MRPGFFYDRRRWNRRNALRLAALAFVGLVVALVFTVTTQMRPLLSSLATAKVSNAVTRIVSEAVYESIESGAIQYTALVSLERTMRGKSPLSTAIWRPSTTCRRRFWTSF